MALPTPEEKAASIERAKKGLASAKTAEDIVTVWKAEYPILGHKAMGRMLVNP